jgi:hypothetical protein
MGNTTVLTGEKTDWDIESLLSQVSMRATDAYRLGYIEGQAQAFDKAITNIKNDMARPAEMFYQALTRIIPEQDILQHRIGVDYTTGIPTSLSVISQIHEEKMVEIMDIAAEIELYMFREYGYDCSFWIITDYSLDQSLISHDFPYSRKGT